MRISTRQTRRRAGSRASQGCFALVLLLIGGSEAKAQSLSILAGNAHVEGVRPAFVRVQFDPGSAMIEDYRMTFTFPPELLELPRISACRTSAQCTVNAVDHSVSVLRNNSGSGSLSAETACVMEFHAAPGATPSFATLDVAGFDFADATGAPVAGSATSGAIGILPGESSPIWQFVPSPDPDCEADSTAEVGLAPAPEGPEASIHIDPAGTSANAQPVAISCGVSSGFTMVSGGEQEIRGNQTPEPIVLGCNSVSATTGTLVCLEGSSGGEQGIYWDLVCSESVFAHDFEESAGH